MFHWIIQQAHEKKGLRDFDQVRDLSVCETTDDWRMSFITQIKHFSFIKHNQNTFSIILYTLTKLTFDDSNLQRDHFVAHERWFSIEYHYFYLDSVNPCVLFYLF